MKRPPIELHAMHSVAEICSTERLVPKYIFNLAVQQLQVNFLLLGLAGRVFNWADRHLA